MEIAQLGSLAESELTDKLRKLLPAYPSVVVKLKTGNVWDNCPVLSDLE